MTEEQRSGEMRKVDGGYYTKKQTCSRCGDEYEAKYITLFTTPRDFSGGLCLKCRNEEREAELKQEEAARQMEVSRQKTEWRRECGIPPKFMNQEFGTFDAKRTGNIKLAYDKCLKYAKGFPIEYMKHLKVKGEAYPSLLLFSTDVWGIGKTHLSCSIIHHILNRYDGEPVTCPVLFCSEPDLYRRIQATYNYTAEEKRMRESEDDILNSMIYRSLLVLDDVGKERRSDPKFVQRILFSIIDGRYKNQRPLVLTTNMSPAELKEYLSGGKGDEASFDRLWEMTGGSFFQIKGKSYRRDNEQDS